MRRHVVAVAFLLALAAVPPTRGGEVRPATVEGTSLVVVAGDGRRVSGQALVGAVVVADELTARQEVFRIDGVQLDPDDPEITLHDLSVRDGATGEWKRYCVPDERGVAGGLFLSGSWDARGAHRRDGRFSATCTSGAIGKCVRYGYKPWKTAPDGRPMWDYHQACTRLIRADYCGDGQSHTREGVRIEIIDRIGAAEEPGNGLAFEAAWTPEGASCLARPRLPTHVPEAIAARCPERLRGRTGEAGRCHLAAELAKPDVLLVNKSPIEPP